MSRSDMGLEKIINFTLADVGPTQKHKRNQRKREIEPSKRYYQQVLAEYLNDCSKVIFIEIK